jgi:hypothetical protein
VASAASIVSALARVARASPVAVPAERETHEDDTEYYEDKEECHDANGDSADDKNQYLTSI